MYRDSMGNQTIRIKTFPRQNHINNTMFMYDGIRTLVEAFYQSE